MKKQLNWRTFTTVFTVAAIVYAIRTKQSHGTFLTVPFEFRVPTWQRVRGRIWNADDPRFFTPHVFGVGWSVNLYRVLSLIRGEDKGVLGAGTTEESDRLT